jgi:hypothetical protein
MPSTAFITFIQFRPISWKGNAIKANGIMGKEIKPFSCEPNNGEICLHTKLELG